MMMNAIKKRMLNFEPQFYPSRHCSPVLVVSNMTTYQFSPVEQTIRRMKDLWKFEKFERSDIWSPVLMPEKS
jgi:hypothetical protein